MFNTHSRCSSLLELSLSRYHINLHEDLNFATNFFVMNNEKEQPKPEVNLEPVELLGSLTTYNGVQRGESPGQTVRTSARVFKKMRQDSSQTQLSTSSITPVQDSTEKDRKEIKQDIAEKLEKESGISSSNLSSGMISKQSTNTAKQRMPKALWSTSEKNLFFEALNEYGKDFDSITAYICNKMKKKGVPDNMTKKKHQVSHFYYRTWQKVSKHIKFGDDVKKVVQELYTLINYGEMKKRLLSAVIARAMCRLSELVWHGVVAIRAGGKTVRVRTPICRALRRLNKLEEWEENLRLPSRIAVCLNPRDMEAWSRVHAAAHNPRLLLAAAPSRRIAPVLTSLQRRWLSPTDFVRETLIASDECKNIDVSHSLDQQINSVLNQSSNSVVTLNKINLHNNTSPEHCIDIKKDIKNCSSKTDELPQLQDGNLIKNNSNLSIAQDVQINEDIVENVGKISVEGKNKLDEIVSSSFEVTNKNLELKNKPVKKTEEGVEKSCKWQVVDESKDLMLYVGPRPGTDINIPTINVSEHLTSQRISLSVYQERLGSGSTCMQTSNNQPNSGIKVGGRLKAKRQRKDSGGDNDPSKKQKTDNENSDKNDLNFNIFDIDETANDGMNGVLSENKTSYIPKDLLNDEKSNDDRDFIDFGDREFFSEHEYDDKYNETDGECDVAVKSVKNSKSTVKMKTKKERDISAGQNRDNPSNDNNEDGKPSNTFSTFFKKNWNRDLLLEKIQKGWSFYDAGDLTFGDLYLMFGVESKLDLNYWWAKGTMPLPDNIINQIKQSNEKNDNPCEKSNKDTDNVNTQSVSVEEKNKKCDLQLDVELLSPNHSDHVETDDSHVLSPDPKLHHSIEDEPNMSSLNLISKIINNPNISANTSLQSYSESKLSDSPMMVRQRDQVISLTMRLKKLLSLSQLYLKKGSTSCTCGHVCSGARGKKINPIINMNDIVIPGTSDMNVCKFPVFRIPYKHQVNAQNMKNTQVIRTDGLTNQLSTNNSQVQGEDFIPKQIINFLPKPIVNVLPKPIVNILPKKNENDVSPEVFRAPLIKPRGGSAVELHQLPDAIKQKLDFSNLPPWTNRAGKRRKPDIPMASRRLVPLAPRPSKSELQAATNAKQNSPKIVTISPISTLTTKLPQLLPAICVRVVPTTSDLSKLSPTVVSDSGKQNSSPEIKKSDVSFVSSTTNDDDKSSDFRSNVSVFGSTSKSSVNWNSDDILSNPKEIIQEGGPCLSNLLDISLPSNIGDENSIGVGSIKTEAMYVPSKCDDFSDVALLKTESTNLSIPSMSPSQLLKIENDENWLSAEQDFSLSSFLGHLEGGPLKQGTDSSLKDSTNTPSSHLVDLNISSRGTEETVETQFQCLMSETSIDYMAKFADLAAQVAADNTK